MKRFYIPVALGLVLLLSVGCDGVTPEPFNIDPPREVADEDYIVTPSGLKYYDFVVGDGALIDTSGPADVAVRMHFNLWLESGELIDSTLLSGSQLTAILGRGELVPGWEEGLEGMRIGGDRQMIIPPELAYGNTGSVELGVPPQSMLLLEVVVTNVGVPIS